MNNVGDCVAKTIEPPILMSRILTFMLATSVVVLITLVLALFKMMPLERPEVFFLLNNPVSVNTVIEPMVPDAMNESALANYEQGFVREYVILRNTLLSNSALTRKNWATTIKSWSNNRVYAALTRTALYTEYNSGDVPLTLSCMVNFLDTNNDAAVVKTGHNEKYDEYIVSFAWVCKNSGGQTTQKNYRIQIRIQSDLDKNVSETVDNLKKLSINPLGIQVTQYTVLDGKGDPLNSDVTAW